MERVSEKVACMGGVSWREFVCIAAFYFDSPKYNTEGEKKAKHVLQIKNPFEI